MVEEESGAVLASHGSNQALPIASATKLMTAYLAMEALAPTEIVRAAPYRAGPGESLMGLKPGEDVSARDLFDGLLVASGNDAASTLAIRVSGSVPGFVERMNRAATDLGLGETSYSDPIGLDERNTSSPRDLVDLAVVLRRDPMFRKIVNARHVTVELAAGRKRLVNRNDLVLEAPFVSGVKTGSTVAAGFVLVASAERRGVGFVAAVLGAPTEVARDQGALELLRYGASLYRSRVLVEQGERVATFRLGDGRGSVPLIAGEAFAAVARRDQRPRLHFEPGDPPTGPIDRGEVVGRATVMLAGATVGEIPILAARSAPALPARGIDALPGWAWAVLGLAVAVAILLTARAVAIWRNSPR